MALETLKLQRIKCYLDKCMLPLLQSGFGRTVPYIMASVLLSLGPLKTLSAATQLGVGPRDWGFPGIQGQDIAQVVPLPHVL